MTEGEAKKSGGIGKVIGIGCLVIVLVIGIAIAAIVMNFKKLVAGGATMAIKSVIEQSGLPADEQAAIMKPINALADEVKAGTMTMEQLGVVLTSIADGPMMSLIMVKTIDIKYIQASALPAAEKKEGHKVASRYAEGCAQGLIVLDADGQGLSSIVTIKTTDAEGKTTSTLKESITPEELQECLSIMKKAADGAAIADKTYPMDIGKTISDAIADAKATQPKALPAQ